MLSKDTAKRRAPIVLITRPEGQQLAFSDGCKDLGYAVALLPCLQIIPCPTDPSQLKQLLDSHDTTLFTSANAVRHAHRVLPLPWPDRQLHAIGTATANALKQHKQTLTLVPQPPFNSEAYLEQLSDQAPGKLLIIKGRGGRNVIQPWLTAQGWQVGSVDVYERIRPRIPSHTIDAIFTDNAPDIISVTSDEVLTNLWELCHQHQHKLQNTPLVVNSNRCAERAADLGCLGPILIADAAGDQGQLSRLVHWKESVFDVQT